MKPLLLTALSAALMLPACLEPQPAPELETRNAAEFTVTTLASGLASPVTVAELPGGSFLITEKAGKLWHIDGGDKTEIAGVPEVYAKGQGGLIDVALAPDFAETQVIYLSYAHGTPDANGTRLLRAKLGETELIDPNVIFEASPLKSAHSHYGGRIAFLHDGRIALTLGDGFHLREEAQNLDSHLGKVVRMNPDGSDAKIYSMGHRNVQGAHFVREGATLWTHEHGPRGGDELNLTDPGQNYGWPIATHGLDYNGAKISPFTSYERMRDPVHVWTPSIAPSGLTIYQGDMFPEWRGDAFVGGLASRDVRRVDLEEQASVGETKLFGDLRARVRDVREASDGALLILTENNLDADGKIIGEGTPTGKLLRVTP